MTKLVNRAKMTTATTGTGTISLASAVDGYQTFTNAGVANADVVRYVIEDGSAWEIGLGTYSAGTLTRVLDESSTGSLLNLSGDAVVYVTAAGEDIVQPSDLATVATSGAYSDLSGLPTLGTAAATDATAYATAAQGSLADSAMQPADNISTLTNDVGYITSADGGNADLLDGQHGAYYLDYTNFTNTPTIPAGYTDADVDTHLNTGTAASGEVLSWTGSDYDWIAVSGGATDINGLSDGYSDGSSVGLGSGALANDDGANENTAVGINAGSTLTTGTRNTSIGIGCNPISATDDYTVVVGSYSKASNGGISIGYAALNSSTGANRTVAIGREAGRNLSAADCVAIGQNALYGASGADVTGTSNIGIGYQTGYDLTTGANNFLGGYRAGTNLTTGSNNVALCDGALDAATTGGRNIAIGQDAMGAGVATSASGDNVAIGYQAGLNITSGTSNISIGNQALRATTTSGSNTAIGNNSLYSNTGSTNTAVGSSALFANTSGSNNTALGRSALYGGGAGLTGSGNTGVGHSAGQNLSSGTNNFFGGYQAGDATTTGSNQIVIGYQADASSATVSNEITLGNASITRFRVPGIQAAASDGDVLTYDATNGIMSLQAPAGGGGVGSVNTQVFTSSGTYTPTAGTAFIEVIVVGGGGSGGSTFGGFAFSDGGGVVTSGGTGGNTLIATVDISDVGSSATVTVGAGGVSGNSSVNGGNSSFVGDFVTLSALGGVKGIDQFGPSATNDDWIISSVVQPASQTPPAGATLILGGQGESGIISSNRSANRDFVRGGYGGDTLFGKGGKDSLYEYSGTSYSQFNAPDGIGYGSGGSGLFWRSTNNSFNSNGAGANGIVIIKEYLA